MHLILLILKPKITDINAHITVMLYVVCHFTLN